MITRRFSKIAKIDSDKLKKFQYISANKVIPNTSVVSQYARMYGRHIRGVVYK